MAQRTSTLQAAPSSASAGSWLSFKRLWRTDATVNVISGDLLAVFASPVGEWMGMNDDGILLLRVIGVSMVLYGLWQFWNARSGTISKTAYLMAAVDMVLFSAVMFGAIAFGVEMNDIGTGLAVLLGISAIALVDIWYIASRKA